MKDKLLYPREVFAAIPELRDNAQSIRDAHLNILDVVFFASMMEEEGESVPISVVVDHDGELERVTDSANESLPAWFVMRLNPVELVPANLKRLARGTEYGRDLIVVEQRQGELFITGVAHRRPDTNGGDALRIAAPRPGCLILEGRDRQLFQYSCGRQLDVDSDVLWEDGPVRTALEACGIKDTIWILSETLRQARATQAGAMFIFLPASAPTPQAVKYQFQEPATIERLEQLQRSQLLRQIAEVRIDAPISSDALEEQTYLRQEYQGTRKDISSICEILARLSAIDGAVVVKQGFHVIGAGFIISTGDDRISIPEPIFCTDVSGRKTEPQPLTGGARRAAGLRFAWMNPGCVVFILSSDGPVTCTLRHEDKLLTWSVRLPET